MGRDLHSPHPFPPFFYFNPLSPHGERRGGGSRRADQAISIHSPRMGRDTWRGRKHGRAENISIHSPRMGRDHLMQNTDQGDVHFNPLSPHGERHNRAKVHNYADNFNPLSPHGERRFIQCCIRFLFYFNPLSPHGERRFWALKMCRMKNFNPLSPHGERRLDDNGTHHAPAISIHSPRMGRDLYVSVNSITLSYFNPLSPHGERQFLANLLNRPTLFQSTLPAWGETYSSISRIKA